MRVYVAVTDNDLFRHLRTQNSLDEVNFWQPTARAFRALAPGEPLLFKLHSPENFIVGGGFFAHFTSLPCSFAWEAFGDKNGVPTLAEMRRRIRKYRRNRLEPKEDPTLGCILLEAPFFFDPVDWIPAPADFRPSIVRGKGYDLSSPAGRSLWEAVRARLRPTQPVSTGDGQASFYGEPVLIRPRLGPGTFQVLVADAYARRCAITGEPALPALEAALIRPRSEGGLHRVDNGLLLRSDLRRLFDRGLLTVTPSYQVRLAKTLPAEEEGSAYGPLAGSRISLPAEEALRPRPEFLAWHGETMFRG